jgi:hypothetical protein
MKNSKKSSSDLFIPIKIFQLSNLIKEAEIDIRFFRDQCDIKKYFLQYALEERPSKLFRKKYRNWIDIISRLESEYNEAFSNYLQEIEIFDGLMESLRELREEE